MSRRITVEHIDKLIADQEAYCVRLKKTRDEVSTVEFFEVGIDKQSHEIVDISSYLEYGPDLRIQVTSLKSGIKRFLTLQDFKDTIVEYSPKMRMLLPAKD